MNIAINPACNLTINGSDRRNSFGESPRYKSSCIICSCDLVRLAVCTVTWSILGFFLFLFFFFPLEKKEEKEEKPISVNKKDSLFDRYLLTSSIVTNL